MLRIKTSYVALAVAASLGFTVAQAAVTRVSGEGVGAGESGGKCRVVVSRDRDAGAYVVTRLVEDSGCTCFVNTGPTNQGGSAEASVVDIVRDKTCDGAPPAVALGGPTGAGAGGGIGAGGAIAGGAAVAAGVIAGASGGSDSPGS